MKPWFFILMLLLISTTGFSQVKTNCEVYFSANVSNNQLSTFSQKVISGGDGVISYQWSFGDGYSSTSQNPEHVYLHPGNYVTCLTVQFDNNCITTYCDTVSVSYFSVDTTKNYGISGNVFAGSASLPNGIAILISKDSSQNYRAVRYAEIQQGFYSFSYLKYGKYLIYAIPYFDVNVLYSPNYFPTYYGNELDWQDASLITVNGFYHNMDIYLENSDDILYGNDSISGTVFISDSTYFEYNVYLNNWFCDSLPSQADLQLAPNQVLLLLDENEKTQRFSLTNHEGKFVFYDLPQQILKLRLEKHGLYSASTDINLQQPHADVNFTIQPHSITIGVEENEMNPQHYMAVYPNPVENIATVHVVTDAITDITIQVCDISGKFVFNQTFKNNLTDNYLIPFNHLASGTYLLNILFPNSSPFQSILLKK
jgi:PKD repeat protein